MVGLIIFTIFERNEIIMIIATLILTYLITIFLMIKLVRYCNQSTINTGWKTEGVEIFVLILILAPILNIIVMIVILFDVFIVNGDFIPNGDKIRVKLNEFFNPKHKV